MLLALGLALGVLVAVLLLPSDDRPQQPRAAQDRRGPVLLVTGYGGGTSELRRLAVVLRAAGRQVEVVEPVGNGTGDLRVQAERLRDAAGARLAAGAPSVDVVGFSAGGVVARIWVDRLGGASAARRVVTLGSPHQGTEVAALGAAFAPRSCPAACRQLVPGSPLLADLPQSPTGPRWVSIWTRQDDAVAPPVSSRLDGAVNVELQQVCADAQVGHGALPSDPLVLGLVLRALAVQPMEREPVPADCTTLRQGLP